MQLSTNNLPTGTPMTEKLPMFNPLELMLRRKSMENEEPPVIEYDQKDINELEEFCKKHGIVGFNCNRMSPKSSFKYVET